jgi:tetratricopeptide (TPR) repeat protein
VKGNLDEAIHCYREALRIRPDLAEVLYNLGIALLTKGNLDEAIHCYREALRIRPEYVEAHYNLGSALRAKGNLDEAIQAYENFIRYTPPQYLPQVEKVKEIIKELQKHV